MAKPEFSILDHGAGYRLVKFEIPGGVTTPQEFAEVVSAIEDQLPGTQPIMLNGRGPVWGYGMLIHAAHPTPAVGCYDPRVAGYVVVASHNEEYYVGQVLPDPENPD